MAGQLNNISLLLIGAGGHCRSCIEVVESTGEYSIRGLIGTDTERNNRVLGHPVLGTDADLPDLLDDNMTAIVAIGQIRTAAPRKEAFERLMELGIKPPAITASSSICSQHAEVGAGSVVMHKALVNAGAVVGSNCILNSGSIVEHDATIGHHCHISTGAIVNGGAHVGSESFVGSRAVLFHGVSVGDGCIIGAGVIVRKDVPDGTTVVHS